MNARKVFLIIFCCFSNAIVIVSCISSCPSIVTASLVKSDELPDYYWRDYDGLVPDDAIEGGKDQYGNPTYVGQAYFEKYELLPVIITHGCKIARSTAYASEITTDKNIKILCSKHKEYIEWIPTHNNETHLLTDRILIIGGYEVGHRLNIGRINHGGMIIIGKVFSYPLGNRGLWIPLDGKPANFLSYEILTFNEKAVPKLSQVDIRILEDTD